MKGPIYTYPATSKRCTYMGLHTLTLHKQPVCPALVKSILMTAVKHVPLGKYSRLSIDSITVLSLRGAGQARALFWTVDFNRTFTCSLELL